MCSMLMWFRPPFVKSVRYWIVANVKLRRDTLWIYPKNLVIILQGDATAGRFFGLAR